MVTGTTSAPVGHVATAAGTLIRADLLEPAVDEALLEVLGPAEITERTVEAGDDHMRAKAEVGKSLRDLVDERFVRGVVRAETARRRARQCHPDQREGDHPRHVRRDVHVDNDPAGGDYPKLARDPADQGGWDYEGYVSYGIGVSDKEPVSVHRLTHPDRVYMDIKTP